MTHTLHPEIEKTIQRLVNRIKQDVVTWKEDDVYWLIIWYLWPYLLPPSQHLKDEPTDMKHHRSILLGWDKWAGGWDMSCDVYWYYRDWKFYITNIEHRVEDNEPLPEQKVCTACLWHKTHSKYTASKGTIEVNCSRCNGTGLETVYDEKPKTYTFEQMEAEYDRWFTNWLLAIGGKKEGLKQSTPKIEESLESKFEALSKLVWGLVVLVDEHLDYHKKYKL